MGSLSASLGTSSGCECRVAGSQASAIPTSYSACVAGDSQYLRLLRLEGRCASARGQSGFHFSATSYLCVNCVSIGLTKNIGHAEQQKRSFRV